MDFGDVFAFLVFLFFVVVLPLLSKLAGKKGRSPDLSPGVPPSQQSKRGGLMATLDEALRQAATQAERPVPSEHTRSRGEHQRTAAEHRRTASEHRRTASETRRTASEHRRTASEQQPTMAEHRPTASEHTKGDVDVGRAPIGSRRRKTRPGFVGSVFAELRGPASLSRAIVLREILGPPVSLRNPPQDGGV
ncbi:MAG: hypothetical protein GY856_08260 [bacterium]|nr:hypothetical protein [bacterium]